MLLHIRFLLLFSRSYYLHFRWAFQDWELENVFFFFWASLFLYAEAWGDDNLTWSWLRLVYLMCALTISCCLVLSLMSFLGSAFGVQRCLTKCLSFYGQQLGMGYSSLIILLSEVNPWLIGVAYVVVVMENLWNIFYFTVIFLMPYGMEFLRCLGFNGGNAEDS